jgi:hypothetical protein
MPNWCNNTFEMVGPKEKVREFEKFLNDNGGKEWFDFFRPCPQELKDVGNVPHNHTNAELEEKFGYSDWYSWSIDNWGCKWNCDAQDWTVNDYDDENLSISFWFDSPWGPPIALYEFIDQSDEFEGLTIFGNYHEEGMQFIGKYEYGSDECYNYSDLDSLDEIPEEIIEEWNLRERLEEQAEWDSEEEDEEWDAEAALDEIEVPEEEPKGSQVNTPEGRDWLRGLLRDEKVTITFTKKDGTERTMVCTLAESKIPSEKSPKNTGKSQSDEALAVFDLEKQDWRSFRFDSVKNIEFTLGE